jgi:hypothetical protein
MTEESPYKFLDEIDFSILTMRWPNLVFFDDLFLGMQGMNIGVADTVITQYEYDLLQEYIEIERTPLDTAILVSAFSQMWVFGLYELLRQWRERKFNSEKWYKNGGLNDKIKHLTDNDSLNLAKNMRREQLERYRDDIELRERLKSQWTLLEPVYRMVEMYRMNLAKHSVPGKGNLMPPAPGYGRINMLCGAMDYELMDKDENYDIMNRRDIADALREVFLRL